MLWQREEFQVSIRPGKQAPNSVPCSIRPVSTHTLTRNECEPQVKGFTGSRFKKFTSRKDAEQFIGLPARHSSSSSIPSTSKAKMSRIKSVAFSTKAGPEEDGWDVVYADGACKGNGKPGSVAGIGVWGGENDSRYLSCAVAYHILPE